MVCGSLTIADTANNSSDHEHGKAISRSLEYASCGTDESADPESLSAAQTITEASSKYAS